MSQVISLGGAGGTSTVETLTSNVGGAVPPTAGNINVLGDTVGITGTGNPGTSTITFSLTGVVPTSFPANVGTAIPAANSLTVTGAGPITTFGAANVLTINTDGTVATQYNGNVGSAVPAGGILQILGAGSINTTCAANVVTISGGGGGVSSWTEVNMGTTMAVNVGYIANGGALISLMLPAVAAVGDIIRVLIKSASLAIITQNAGQTIHFGNQDSTTGGAGSILATAQYDSVELLCITANTDFAVLSSVGNWTVT